MFSLQCSEGILLALSQQSTNLFNLSDVFTMQKYKGLIHKSLCFSSKIDGAAPIYSNHKVNSKCLF